MKHWATGYTYSEDEIEEEKYFDIPGAYLCQSGEIGWKEQSVMDHPDIKAWIGASR